MKINVIELIEKNKMKATEYTVSIVVSCNGRIEHRFFHYHIGRDTVDIIVDGILEEFMIERDANYDDYSNTTEIRIIGGAKFIKITYTPENIYIKHRNGEVERLEYGRT